MNSFIAKNFVYFPVQSLRGLKVKKYIKNTKNNQFLSSDELQKLQNHKLKRLLEFVSQHNDFYKNILKTQNVHHTDIKTIDDLAKIPILSKRDILGSQNLIITKNFHEKTYSTQTGGSTGITLHLKKEASCLALRHALMNRCYSWYNIDIGDKQVRFWGVPVNLQLWLNRRMKDLVLNRIRVSAFNISEEECEHQFKRIKKYKPAYIYGYTTAIYGFCYFLKKRGINLADLKLKAVICTAEKMYPHHKTLFEEMFNCPVVDEYGCAEHGIIAFQCRHGSMHIMSDHLIVEFLNEKEETVGPGEPGRIVITDLNSYAMPLIRYDIGDIGIPCDDKCSCGVTLPRMQVIEGRQEDFIRTNDEKLVHTAYLCYTLKNNAVNEFKMYQRSVDDFLVQIVKSAEFNENSEKMLAQNLYSELGEKIKLEFEYLDCIPREKSGKLRYFVSEIQK